MKYFLAACVFIAFSLSTAILTEGVLSDFGRGSLSATMGSIAGWLTFLALDKKKSKH